MKKALLIYSGGLDSTVLLYWLLKVKKRQVTCLNINYGSKHNDQEVKHVQKIHELVSKSYKLKTLFLDIKCLGSFLKSGLIEGELPESHYESKDQIATVVPFRNSIMALIACSIAESEGIDEIYIGAHKGDRKIYRDCRTEYFNELNKLIKKASTKACSSIKVIAPFLNLDKEGVIIAGLKLQVPFDMTWTCYNGKSEPCGKCASCQERDAGFKKAKKLI